MATIRFILGLICLVGLLSNRLPHRNLLNRKAESLAADTAESTRRKLLAIAESQVGVRENGGNNKGSEIKAYLAYTKLPPGYPWCAAFVSWVYGKAGLRQPQTAWSPALFPTHRRIATPQPADVFGMYFPKLKRIAHCGIVSQIKGNWIITIEGNTNLDGSNEGDGVYRKWRHQKTIAAYARWLPEKGVNDE